MPPEKSVITIQSDLDIVTARSGVRTIAKQQGFVPIDQARLATAVSELARNIFLYAGIGTVTLTPIEQAGRKGMEIICEDKGPGISDIALAMQDEFSTSGGRGMGLPGAKRLMDEFDIQSTVGQGTRIVCRKWRPQ
jgi:serine/threonine-protein kinase RsbT